MKTLITEDPFLHLNVDKNWHERGLWPCWWIGHPEAPTTPFLAAFRKRFTVDHSAVLRLHVTADERYDLFLDGDRVGRGPERSSPDLWFYDTYDLEIKAGKHLLVARVWALGDQAPDAQMSVFPGLLVAPEGEWMDRLGTGLADWEVKLLAGYRFVRSDLAAWKGARVEVDGNQFSWGFERGEGAGWVKASPIVRGVSRRIDWSFPPMHLLQPATLPPMMDRPRHTGVVRFVGEVPGMDTRPIPVLQAENLKQETAWGGLVAGTGQATVPSHTLRRVLIDLQEYYTAYPELVVSGGAGSLIRLNWAESLYNANGNTRTPKGNRDEIEGKYFIGHGDSFSPDGSEHRKYETLWWQAGRYVELTVKTADQPLTVESFGLSEARYPLEMESEFHSNDRRLEAVIPLLARGMQVCSNETFFDCPYYEELMYTGDSRLEALATYIMTRDDRLPRKSIRMFDSSRLASGLTQSRFPCHAFQIISTFSLWWVGMVQEYSLWRDDRAFIDAMMPGVRATLEGFRHYYGPEGLLHGPEGWNTMDWVPAWDVDAGIPPDGVTGVSGVLNWQLVYTLSLAADLEESLGEPLLAQRNRQHAEEMAGRALEAFWDEKRGLLADDLAHRRYSEHTQCMAVLSRMLPADRQKRIVEGLLTAPDLERATIYFSHYLFETLRQVSRVDALFDRLPLWFGLLDNGLKTPIEMPEPTRSDCHGWGSHPLFHYFATILGIRPAGLGFRKVEIRPQLGPLQHASGRMVHPTGGEIGVDFSVDRGRLRGKVTLPAGLTGTLHANGKVVPLVKEETEF